MPVFIANGPEWNNAKVKIEADQVFSVAFNGFSKKTEITVQKGGSCEVSLCDTFTASIKSPGAIPVIGTVQDVKAKLGIS